MTHYSAIHLSRDQTCDRTFMHRERLVRRFGFLAFVGDLCRTHGDGWPKAYADEIITPSAARSRLRHTIGDGILFMLRLVLAVGLRPVQELIQELIPT